MTETPLTEDQMKEAVEQMKVQCDLKMPNYEMVSARSLLYELGYSTYGVSQVLEYIAGHGFEYCLDYRIECGNGIDCRREYPAYEVCWWGPDQMKSRLGCLRSYTV